MWGFFGQSVLRDLLMSFNLFSMMVVSVINIGSSGFFSNILRIFWGLLKILGKNEKFIGGDFLFKKVNFM